MQVNLINKRSYFEINQAYIQQIKGLADSIFQAEQFGPIGYLQSNQSNFEHTRHKNIIDQKSIFKILPSKNENQTFIHPCISLDGLGPFEQAVISNILNSEYSTIVITGALGSGKSSIVNFILEYLDKNIAHEKCNHNSKCRSHDALYIIINFIEGFNSNRTEDILDEFDAKLYDKFTHVIRKLYRDDKLLQEFVDFATDPEENSYTSFKFLGRKIKQCAEWNDLETNDKVETILDWLHYRFGSEFTLSYKNTVLARMINFVGLKFPERLNGCFILLYDNIDRFKDEVQNEVINRLLGVSKIINAKSIICSRLTTFGKISGNSSFAFGVIENAGHLPTAIVEKRLEHYLSNRDSYPKYISARSVIPPKFLKAFDSRIEELYKHLTTKKHSRLKETLESLSGLSIRRGLHLARRVIINYVSDYSTIPEEDMLISGILCKDNANALMAYDDRRITNIFLSSHSLKNCLINIRILGILYTYKTNNKPIRISELLYYLELYGINSQEEIFSSMYTLTGLRKRLIYINGISDIVEKDLFNDKDLSQSFVQLTWAGQKYYTTLCENLQYLQDCFSIINWSDFATKDCYMSISNYITKTKIEFENDFFFSETIISSLENSLKENIEGSISEIMPKEIDNSNFLQRIMFLRKGLYIYLYEDIYQSITYNENIYDPEKLPQNNTIITINELSTVNLIATIARSVLRISKSNNYFKNKGIYEEVLNWKSLLNSAFYWNYFIFRTKSSLCLAVLREYYNEN